MESSESVLKERTTGGEGGKNIDTKFRRDVEHFINGYYSSSRSSKLEP